MARVNGSIGDVDNRWQLPTLDIYSARLVINRPELENGVSVDYANRIYLEMQSTWKCNFLTPVTPGPTKMPTAHLRIYINQAL